MEMFAHGQKAQEEEKGNKDGGHVFWTRCTTPFRASLFIIEVRVMVVCKSSYR